VIRQTHGGKGDAVRKGDASAYSRGYDLLYSKPAVIETDKEIASGKNKLYKKESN
jgi:hypothetical protein